MEITRLTVPVARAFRLSPSLACLIALLATAGHVSAAGGPTSFAPARLPSLEGSPVSYVIITPAALAPEFERLASWRTRSGLPAVVRSTEEIFAAYGAGADEAERLRLFIRDAHRLWGTGWILLGGDSDVLPARYAHTSFYGGADLLTDLYFSCLDGNWNADGDAIFGEAAVESIAGSGDDADLGPEVFLGRAPVSTLEQAKVFVDKTLDYERRPPPGWSERALLLGEVLFPSAWTPGDPAPQLDGAMVANRTLALFPPAFDVTRLYQNNPAWPGSLYESRRAAIDSMNAGYAIVHHVGHGFRFNLSVGDASIVNADADALTNGDRTFLLYALNCTSAAFNFNCVSERFLENPNGGAVAVLGSTDLDFVTTSMDYQDVFYEKLFAQGYDRVGEAFTLANAAFAAQAEYDGAHRWTQFCLVLLGDPSLRIWSSVPRELAVTHPAVVPLGSPELAVTVLCEGSPLSGALVTLDKEGDTYASAVTGPDGVAHVPFWPRAEGAFSVVATAKNAVPYEGSAAVTSPAAAHVVVQALRLALHPSDGYKSADGDLQAGATMYLKLRFHNTGAAPVSNLWVEGAIADPWVSLAESTSAIPNLAPGQDAWMYGWLRLVIAREIPDGRRVHCEIQVRGSNGFITGELLEFRAISPRPELVEALPPSGGPAQSAFSLRVTNDGMGGLSKWRAVLSRFSGVASLIDSIANLDTLATGQTATVGPFVYEPAAGDPRFFLHVEDDVGTLLDSVIVDFSPPPTPQGIAATGGTDRIRVSWSVPEGADDLQGYRVYRAEAATGQYVRVTSDPVRGASVFEDAGLAPTTTFFYRVSSLDEAGNESALSDSVVMITSPPMESGWPATVSLDSPSAPALADVDGDSIPEIIAGGDEVYVFHSDGTELRDGDNNSLTLGVFTTQGFRYWSCPAVGDLDGDEEPEIVACSWQDQPDQTPQVGRLFVWRASGEVAPGWPQPFLDSPANPWATPALGDLDGDGTLEIVVPSRGRVYAFHHDGTDVLDGDADPGTNGVFMGLSGADYMYGSAALADIDGDGRDEIIVLDRGRPGGSRLHVMNGDGSSAARFPFTVGSSQTTSSPAVVDINGDGIQEIIFGAGDNHVYAVHLSGSNVQGWPASGPVLSGYTDFQSSPAVGDINGDGDLDVVIGSNDGRLFAWRGKDGAILPGFPLQVAPPGFRLGSPIIGEMDGESPEREVIVPAFDGKLYALNHDGTAVPGFPYVTSGEMPAGALLGDADRDGVQNLLFQSSDQHIYLLEFPGVPAMPSQDPWPMFRQNAHRNGRVLRGPTVDVVLEDPDEGAAAARAAFPQPGPNPFSPSVSFQVVVPGGGGERVSLRLFDVKGCLVRELCDRMLPPGAHRLAWDGCDARGRTVPSGVYFAGVKIGRFEAVRRVVRSR
jgi:hypothetical protein